MSQLPNQRCACGSGKKFKKCCASKGMTNSPPPPPTPAERLARFEMERNGRQAMREIECMLGALMAAPMAAMNARRDEEITLQQLQALVDAQTANPDAKIIVLEA